MVNSAIESDSTAWTIVKVWDNGDVSAECFEHYFRRENEEC
jgi:hypothetical protein